MYRLRFLTLVGIVLVAAATRLIPHPPNVTPIGAMALFGGAGFTSRRAGFLVPLSAMLLSDIAIGCVNGDLSIGLHPLLPVVYGSFAVSVCVGYWLRRRRRVGPIFGAVLFSAVVFFVFTNLGVWALDSLYPRTWAGLIECYAAAIPFFRNSLLGDLSYTAALFGGLALAERSFPAVREFPSYSLPA